MKTAMKTLVVLAMVVVMAGCSSTKVMVNYDEVVDFSQYQSYHFVRPKNETKQPKRKQVPDPFFNKEVVREIKPILDAKGFQEAASLEEADLLIHFYSFVQNRRDYVPAGYRVGRYGRVWRTRPGHVVQYKEGTLVIDIVDARKKELVWQGVGQDVLNRQDPGENLVEAVEKVLAKFPPQK
jgi:hypothetical protein